MFLAVCWFTLFFSTRLRFLISSLIRHLLLEDFILTHRRDCWWRLTPFTTSNLALSTGKWESSKFHSFTSLASRQIVLWYTSFKWVEQMADMPLHLCQTGSKNSQRWSLYNGFWYLLCELWCTSAAYHSCREKALYTTIKCACCYLYSFRFRTPELTGTECPMWIMVIHDVQNIPKNDRPALNGCLFDITRLGIVTRHVTGSNSLIFIGSVDYIVCTQKKWREISGLSTSY